MRRATACLLCSGLLAALGGVAFAAPDDVGDRNVARAEALVARFPAERYDVAARAASLGEGIGPSFEFVRDRIGCEPYAGVVRGAEGTLAAESGNSFDRAALLGALLRAKRMKTRFAIGRLSPATAELVLARAFSPPARETPGGGAIVAAARARAARDLTTLRSSLSPLPGSVAADRVAALRDVADHAWVEVESEGRWVALDPTLADASPGAALTSAARTTEVFDDAVHTRVTVRVVVETLAGSELRRVPKLEVTRPLFLWYDRGIQLRNVPQEGGLAGALSGAVAGVGGDALLPVLSIDGEAFVGSPITYASGAVERGKPPSGGLSGLGGLLGSSEAFVTEWLEVEVASPGRAVETNRRAIVDRAGPAWRASARHEASTLAPLPEFDGKTCAALVSVDLWLSVGAHDMRTFAKASHEAAWIAQNEATRSESDEHADDVASRARDRAKLHSIHTFGFGVLGDQLLLRDVGDDAQDADVSVSLDGPRILAFENALVRDGDRTVVRSTVDLVRDRVRALAVRPEAEAKALERKVRYGLLQGALEQEFLAADAAALGAGAVVTTTSSLASSGEMVVLRPTAAAEGAAGFTRPDAAARARDALAAGATLVVPATARAGPLSAWWRIDADGTTSAVLEDMGGGANVFPYPYHRPPGTPGSSPPGVIPRDPGLGPKVPPGKPVRQPPVRPPDQIAPREPGVSPSDEPTVKIPRPPGGGGGGGGGEEDGGKKKKGGGNEYITVVDVVTVAVIGAVLFTVGYYAAAYTSVGERVVDVVESVASTSPAGVGGSRAPPR